MVCWLSWQSLVVGTSNAWWHGSVGRAHRSHRWGRWFESNCHHHSAALENQGLQLFYPPSITAEGCTFFRVHLGDVNSSGRHSVHTVVWLSCRKIGVALLVELAGLVAKIKNRASLMRRSGDALNSLILILLLYASLLLQRSD